MTIENRIANFKSYFCPFGYLDIKKAIEITLEIGEHENWLFDILETRADDLDMKITYLDLCGEVYEQILQEACNQISDLTDYDFLNDFKGSGEIYTSYNYLCSSYNYGEEAKAELTKILKKKKIKKTDLDKKTVWFLEQLEINLK